jgi:DNA-binding MarR family transcriptional regulator
MVFVTDTSAEQRRQISQHAFGQRYRLELMLAIAATDDGIVCLTDLAKTLDVTISNLQSPLRALVDTGLVSPLPRGDSRRKFYIRNPSAAWAWAQELNERSQRDAPSSTPGSAGTATAPRDVMSTRPDNA